MTTINPELEPRIIATHALLVEASARLTELIPTVESIIRRDRAVSDREVVATVREKESLDKAIALDTREAEVVRREKDAASVSKELSLARVARDGAREDARMLDFKYQDVKKQLGVATARLALIDKAFPGLTAAKI
ncbi:MAG: hypothetical protein GZ088_16085 [Acidipila sp.]|nr:hypothetical protein [Acidipila sp.]